MDGRSSGLNCISFKALQFLPQTLELFNFQHFSLLNP